MSGADILGKVSLLWPSEASKEEAEKKQPLSEQSYIDIGLESIVDKFGVNVLYKRYIKSILCCMCEDTEVIKYRLDIIDDILRFPEIEEAVGGILL